MRKFDTIFFGLIIAPVLPIVFLLAGWWSAFPFVSERLIGIFMLTGFLIGCLCDFLFLKPILKNIFNLSLRYQVVIYMFYTVCVFGFFMGVPIFNLFLGLAAGVYAARKAIYDGLEYNQSIKYINKVSIFTTVIIILICISSAFLALTDPYTSNNLEGMLNLSFEVTKEMLYLLVIIGGLSLIILQYFITRLSATFTFKHQIR